MTNTYLFYIIVYKFDYRLALYLVILLPIDKSKKIYLYYTILLLNQAVYLHINDN